MSLGLLFLTRPFDAALVGPAAGLWALGLGGKRLSVGALATTAVSAASVAGLYFVFNAVLTGSPSIAPHHLWADKLFGPGVDAFGFGPNIGIPMWRNMDPLPGHGLPDVVLNANKNFTLMNFELFGWTAGSLLFACLAMQPGGLQRRDTLMIGIILCIVGGHSFYWAPGGPDFGARYWYLTIVPLAVLTVRGAEVIGARLSRASDAVVVGGRVAGWVAMASIAALVTVVPWRGVTKYYRYRDIGRDFEQVVEARRITGALIFVRSPHRADYEAAFTFNPPMLSGPGNIFAWELGPGHEAAVLRQFPARPVWIIGRKFEADRTIDVVAGPFPAGTKSAGPGWAYDQSLQAIIR